MIEAKVKLQPFRTPNFVLTEAKLGKRQDGFQETPKFALSELDEVTLHDLCDEFKRDVFSKAGKELILSGKR